MKLKELGELLLRRAMKCEGRETYNRWGIVSQGCPGHGRLVLRMKRDTGELFWGCSSFPLCSHTSPFNEGYISNQVWSAMREARFR